jgi:MFS family permease
VPKDRNFNLATLASLMVALAQFGAMGYLPTYFQMATGATATQAGLLMIPLMGTLLVTSVVAGSVVSRTGRYKVLPIAGAAVLAISLWLLSTVHVADAGPCCLPARCPMPSGCRSSSRPDRERGRVRQTPRRVRRRRARPFRPAVS